MPAAGQFGAEAWELGQGPETATDPAARVRRQAEHSDESIEILDGRPAEFNSRHRLQVVEIDRVTFGCLAATELRAFPRPVDAVKHSDDRVRIWVGVVDR